MKVVQKEISTEDNLKRIIRKMVLDSDPTKPTTQVVSELASKLAVSEERILELLS